MHAPAPAVTTLVEIRASDDNQVLFPVGALDGRAGQAVVGLVLTPAVHVVEVEGGMGDKLTEHTLDAPLYEVVADIACLRIEVVNLHALLFRQHARGGRFIPSPRVYYQSFQSRPHRHVTKNPKYQRPGQLCV